MTLGAVGLSAKPTIPSMNLRTGSALSVGVALAAASVLCACANAPDPRGRPAGVVVTPDTPDHPRVVRFDVPTAMLVGLPGDRLPVTLEARLSSRALATRELAERGYCPNGFAGPERIDFPGGERGHSVFTVVCVGPTAR